MLTRSDERRVKKASGLERPAIIGSYPAENYVGERIVVVHVESKATFESVSVIINRATGKVEKE